MELLPHFLFSTKLKYFICVTDDCNSKWDGSRKSDVTVVQLPSHVWLWDPWTAALQASLSFTISQSLLRLMSFESVMPSNHRILCHPLLLLPSIFPSIKVFSSESAFPIRGPDYWSFSFRISPSNDYWGLISLGLTGLISLQSKGLSRIFSSTVWKHQFFGALPSLWPNSHIQTWLLERRCCCCCCC